jgi:hypothetical protein
MLVAEGVAKEPDVPASRSTAAYIVPRLEHFATLAGRYAAHAAGDLPFPVGGHASAVPFSVPDELPQEEADSLKQCCIAWTEALKTTLNDLGASAYTDEDGDEDSVDAIPKEYAWWERRAACLSALKEQLSLPAIDRALHLMRSSSDAEARTAASEFEDRFAEAGERLEEAEDNMKFLKGILRQVEVCVQSPSVDGIRVAIPKILKGLRSAWTLSKYYNTDETITLLLRKVRLSSMCYDPLFLTFHFL